MEENRSTRRALTAIVSFLLTATTALILLVVLLLEWLTTLFCSELIATTLVAGLFIVIAIAIYTLSAHRAIEEIKSRWDAIYQVAYSARRGYERAVNLLKSLFNWR
ncbi:MAG: hypothetical protein Q4F45_04620 [Alistipes sp.]|nr:hypothetical protein [Alistipes sp.]MDO5497145.1 hypothetical protein [Alistipes sp.]